ncbi:hypothetical protein IWQ49_006479 [Labrenzia sp. EL_126]|nr:hypothetical protein [Labrenzia sp. EL_126]
MRKRLGTLFKDLSIIAALFMGCGFLPMLILYFLMNGSALYGHVLDDRYFVCNRDYCHEVWPIFYHVSWFVGVFTFSWVFVMWCCGLVSAFLLRRFTFQKGSPLDQTE